MSITYLSCSLAFWPQLLIGQITSADHWPTELSKQLFNFTVPIASIDHFDLVFLKLDHYCTVVRSKNVLPQKFWVKLHVGMWHRMVILWPIMVKKTPKKRICERPGLQTEVQDQRPFWVISLAKSTYKGLKKTMLQHIYNIFCQWLLLGAILGHSGVILEPYRAQNGQI